MQNMTYKKLFSISFKTFWCQTRQSNFSKQHLPPNPNFCQLQSIMDQNPSNGNNTSPAYIPPSYVSPMYEAILPFYEPVNTNYPPVPLEIGHWNATPISVNWNNPAYVPETTDQAPTAPNHPPNYLVSYFVLDTSANINRTTFIANSEQIPDLKNKNPTCKLFNARNVPQSSIPNMHSGAYECSLQTSKKIREDVANNTGNSRQSKARCKYLWHEWK